MVGTASWIKYKYTFVGEMGVVVAHRSERRTFNRGGLGSNPPVAVSKLGQFRSPHFASVYPAA